MNDNLGDREAQFSDINNDFLTAEEKRNLDTIRQIYELNEKNPPDWEGVYKLLDDEWIFKQTGCKPFTNNKGPTAVRKFTEEWSASGIAGELKIRSIAAVSKLVLMRLEIILPSGERLGFLETHEFDDDGVNVGVYLGWEDPEEFVKLFNNG